MNFFNKDRPILLAATWASKSEILSSVFREFLKS